MEASASKAIRRLNGLADDAFRKSDIATAVLAWSRILELDPKNKNSLAQLEAVWPADKKLLEEQVKRIGHASTADLLLAKRNFVGSAWAYQSQGSNYIRYFSENGKCELFQNGNHVWEFPCEFLSPKVVSIRDTTNARFSNINLISGNRLLHLKWDPKKGFHFLCVMEPVEFVPPK